MPKKLPRMEIFRPSPALVDEALLSFDQMRRQLGGLTEQELLDFVGRDTQIDAKEKKEKDLQDDF